jgi:site-specific DNA recombinase
LKPERESRAETELARQRVSAVFPALAKREGVSPSYFTRLVRLSYLAPDITRAIRDGRQPPALTADKLLLHSRLPLA